MEPHRHKRDLVRPAPVVAKKLRGPDYRGLQVLPAEWPDLRDIHACRDKSQPL